MTELTAESLHPQAPPELQRSVDRLADAIARSANPIERQEVARRALLRIELWSPGARLESWAGPYSFSVQEAADEVARELRALASQEPS